MRVLFIIAIPLFASTFVHCSDYGEFLINYTLLITSKNCQIKHSTVEIV